MLTEHPYFLKSCDWIVELLIGLTTNIKKYETYLFKADTIKIKENSLEIVQVVVMALSAKILVQLADNLSASS